LSISKADMNDGTSQPDSLPASSPLLAGGALDSDLWSFGGGGGLSMTWSYDSAAHGQMLELYDKGKQRQWDANMRLDWSEELDPDNPMQLSEQLIPLWGSPLWERLSAAERAQIQLHSRVVQSMPDLDAKFFAATQVMDEARHTEVYARLLKEKFPVRYPIDASLKNLLNDGLSASDWDMALLTMQVLVENVALASFQRIRNNSKANLVTAVNAYVMQDEARHVAFGQRVLRNYYTQLTSAERAQREEFVIESYNQIRAGYWQRAVWEKLGLPADQCVRVARESRAGDDFGLIVLRRLVPVFCEIGLWGPRLQRYFEPMGGDRFVQTDPEQAEAEDETFVAALDAMRAEIAMAGKA